MLIRCIFKPLFDSIYNRQFYVILLYIDVLYCYGGMVYSVVCGSMIIFIVWGGVRVWGMVVWLQSRT